jgi:hypothetical protein
MQPNENTIAKRTNGSSRFVFNGMPIQKDKRLARLVALSWSTQGHSQPPLRFRSWLRPFKQCLSKSGSMAIAINAFKASRGHRRSSRIEWDDTCPKLPPFAEYHMPLAAPPRPPRHLRSMLQFPFWPPNNMWLFRAGEVETEFSRQWFSRLRATV